MCNLFVMAMRANLAKQFLRRNAALVAGLAMVAGIVHRPQDLTPRVLDLPTSKQLMTPTPGNPRPPTACRCRWQSRRIVAGGVFECGYGTFESGYMQSLAVLNVRHGRSEGFSRCTHRWLT